MGQNGDRRWDFILAVVVSEFLRRGSIYDSGFQGGGGNLLPCWKRGDFSEEKVDSVKWCRQAAGDADRGFHIERIGGSKWAITTDNPLLHRQGDS